MSTPYNGKILICLVCGERTEKAPYGGVLLRSGSGNFGSTVYDNNGPSGGVVAFIHDACFVEKVRDGTILSIRKGLDRGREPDEIVKWDPLAPGEPMEGFEE